MRLYLLVLCLLSLPMTVRGDEAEDRSAKWVEKMGGRIERDNKAQGKPIVKVHLGRRAVTDGDLKELAGLKELRWLDLTKTQVTDAGLKELIGLKQLTMLMLTDTRVSDAGLKELTAMKQLQELDLDGTLLTDAGLKELAVLTKLRFIDLTNTKATDEAAAAIKKAVPGCQIRK